MLNVRLCDDICSPSWSNELCRRCIDEQYENLIELCEDVLFDAEQWLYDDEEYVESWFNYDEI